MTDYTYDENESVKLSDTDRSKNAAAALGGYPLDVRPDANWPGLDGTKNQMYLDTDRAGEVAQWLSQQLGKIQRAVTLTSNAGCVSFGPATWLEAQQLASASSQVAQTVAAYSTLLHQSIQTASESISAAQATVSTADDVSGQGARNVDSNLPGAGGAPARSATNPY